MDEAEKAHEILEAGGKMLAHPDTARELRKLESLKPLIESYGGIIASYSVPRGKIVFAMPIEED